MQSKSKLGDESLFLAIVGDSIRNRIVEFFIEGRELDYPIKFVAEELKINRSTLYKVITELSENAILTFSRKIGSSTFYRLNIRNQKVMSLIDIFDKAINKALEEQMVLCEEKCPEIMVESEPSKPIAQTKYSHFYISLMHGYENKPLTKQPIELMPEIELA